MKKVNNLVILLVWFSLSLSADNCNETDDANMIIEDGNIDLSEKINLSFDSAKSTSEDLELKNIKVTSCKKSSFWSLTAENAEIENENLTIQNAKLRIYNVPIFWLGEISLDEEDSFNIPNLGVTDSNLDISYKYKTKSENSEFVLEPIYSNTKFGLSIDYNFDNGVNNFHLNSLALDDENSSWVYDIDSVINLNDFISLTLDYSDFSGNSLVQDYGFKYLDINRRSLDLKQSVGISFLNKNRNISFFSDDFITIGALRPVSHSKDYITYERFYIVNDWFLDISSEYSKFSNNTPESLEIPYIVYDEVERISRDIEIKKNYSFSTLNYESKFLLSSRDYEIKDTNKNLTISNVATSQIFSLLENKTLKIGFIWSTFKDESSLPILDSYPSLPSPESNISLGSWVGKDRSSNSRKLFIYKNWSNYAFDFSISSNLYEKYNFEEENNIFRKFYDKRPIFFSAQTKNKNLNFFAKGNYSYRESDFMGLMAGVEYLDDKTYLSVQKNNIVPSSYPLQPLDNYVLKFKRDFDNFQIFSRAQYSEEEEIINENVLGIQWEYDCFRLRLSMERARFFPFIDPDFAETSYFDLIYLTNPEVKNNLSFEFELVGLTNILTPIDNIINDGLFN
ncbi:MAG: hypothetical protein CBC72_004880 [Gammaproteobacteria bacterium TMED112]|nr:MAG: hypothetical protein CBC72_004880 [Gammaproteobacteria bacterium TMED112]|tara:strand:+ start:2429 stop:4297 length:1869 start_codon:yes stop_codon:yes gene_type:complete